MPGLTNRCPAKVAPGRGSRAKLQPGPARPTAVSARSSHVDAFPRTSVRDSHRVIGSFK
ncbi:hypothetical protein OIB37_01755 [Streptomyces sp. NBC_00820]|uniref:hypothetical protein n=1 Tax=Streptomyces sp. NBC_00820 TaxID=2975842 RepID=UPI002ED3B665|nr:hypothetical protein OIB37_01755 [Streptomyces sp. NBC_00820]